MNKTIKYKDNIERDNIIKSQESKGFRLIEDALTFEGNYLVFTDEPVIEKAYLTAEEKLIQDIETIKRRLDALEGKIK